MKLNSKPLNYTPIYLELHHNEGAPLKFSVVSRKFQQAPPVSSCMKMYGQMDIVRIIISFQFPLHGHKD